jgi:hypothetical protein
MEIIDVERLADVPNMINMRMYTDWTPQEAAAEFTRRMGVQPTHCYRYTAATPDRQGRRGVALYLINRATSPLGSAP